MTTDTDLRLVAEAVGFHPTLAHPTPADLPKKDDCAAHWLLPWLQRQVGPFGGLQVQYIAGGLFHAEIEHRDESHDAGPRHWSSTWSFAAALFDLCLQLAKENQP